MVSYFQRQLTNGFHKWKTLNVTHCTANFTNNNIIFFRTVYSFDSAYYLIGGIYLEDDLGTLFVGEESKYVFTPSIGVGYYDDGKGKKLGNEIQFRTTLEISYQLENRNRIGLAFFSHISNANLGGNNPGVEILNLSYQIPFN